MTLAESGFVALQKINVHTKDGKPVPCKNTKGWNVADPKHAFPIPLATREEIYQKYAVVVALFFSVLASILTIVNVLVAIFR